MTDARAGGNSLPLALIVIPVYNGADYLRQAIDSALGQSYPHRQVIVVNDGSDDHGATRDIAKSYGDRIVYIEKSNGGVATALNAGIEIMQGSFFSWLSHDDLYHPDKLSRQVDFYRDQIDGRVIVFSHQDEINASGYVLTKAEPYVFHKERLYYLLLYRWFISGCSLLVPKSAFEAAGLFDPRYLTAQDYDLWFRMVAKGYEFAYCPITSGMSRIHEGQQSRLKGARCYEEQQELFIKVQKELPSSLWIDTFEDKARAYYYLAYQFGLLGLGQVRRFDLRRGNEALKGMSLAHKTSNMLYRIRLAMYLKYRMFKRARRASRAGRRYA